MLEARDCCICRGPTLSAHSRQAGCLSSNTLTSHGSDKLGSPGALVLADVFQRLLQQQGPAAQQQPPSTNTALHTIRAAHQHFLRMLALAEQGQALGIFCLFTGYDHGSGSSVAVYDNLGTSITLQRMHSPAPTATFAPQGCFLHPTPPHTDIAVPHHLLFAFLHYLHLETHTNSPHMHCTPTQTRTPRSLSNPQDRPEEKEVAVLWVEGLCRAPGVAALGPEHRHIQLVHVLTDVIAGNHLQWVQDKHNTGYATSGEPPQSPAAVGPVMATSPGAPHLYIKKSLKKCYSIQLLTKQRGCLANNLTCTCPSLHAAHNDCIYMEPATRHG